MIELSRNIIDYLGSLYGEETAGKYFDFIKTEHSAYLRMNVFTPDGETKLINNLGGYGIRLAKVKDIPGAYKIISGAELAGKTLEYNLGKYYLQSLSSMIPPIVLAPSESDKVLDLCAAPGSKTTQISALMNNRGTLVSNEIQTDRIKMLVHNFDKLNIVNAGAIQYKGEWLSRVYDNYFDKVLVDAPCSALGVIQKKGEVNNWWSRERVAKIAFLQNMLLAAAIKMTRPGGEIVYSTCTLTPEENELIVYNALKKNPVEAVDISLPLSSEEGFTSYENLQMDGSLSKARRILPWVVDSDGFFVVKLLKTGRTEPAKPLALHFEDKIVSAHSKAVRKYLKDFSNAFGINESVWENYSYLLKGKDMYFVHKGWQDEFPGFFNRIGTRLGLIDKHDKGRLHSFAAQYFHNEITRSVFELQNESQLKDYLNGGIVRTDAPSSEQSVIRFKEYTLGTAAKTNGGLKSQYPKASRIHEIDSY